MLLAETSKIRQIVSWLVPLLMVFAAIAVAHVQANNRPCRLQNFLAPVQPVELVDGQIKVSEKPLILTAWVHSSKKCSRCHDRSDAQEHDHPYTITTNDY